MKTINGEILDCMACEVCGNESIGRFTMKNLEKTGWRKIDGKWTCSICTGLFWGPILNNPDTVRWLMEQREEAKDEDSENGERSGPPNPPPTTN